MNIKYDITLICKKIKYFYGFIIIVIILKFIVLVIFCFYLKTSPNNIGYLKNNLTIQPSCPLKFEKIKNGEINTHNLN